MAKNLNFTKSEGNWISDEFQANGNINLHIERKGKAKLRLLQKTAGTQFADVISDLPAYHMQVVDVDVQVLLPKIFKVISGSEVTEAFITESI